jgi:predicted alpha/beta superfamily hydrolase
MTTEATTTPTVVQVTYPPERGAIGLRGNHAPLSWEHTMEPDEIDGERHLFRLFLEPGEIVELKLVRNEEDWASGRNYAVHGGETLDLYPCFDHDEPTFEPTDSIETPIGKLTFEVLLPPSYSEQTSKRYPVLYVLDGQSLWSHSEDPFGNWSLERTLGGLYELDAIEEVIVVGIHTAEDRMERMTPVPDPDHGGGQAPQMLEALVDGLRPLINERYRTLTGRESTAVMGSSMGGLFAFFAAWKRPDIFGKAACLSSSFWWANRWAIRAIQEEGTREPRPLLYLDSGASMSALERDANLRDGFQHTRSMLRNLLAGGYTLGTDLHRLVFAGQAHNAEAWSSRVALPLQLLFPPASRVTEAPPAQAAELGQGPRRPAPAVESPRGALPRRAALRRRARIDRGEARHRTPRGSAAPLAAVASAPAASVARARPHCSQGEDRRARRTKRKTSRIDAFASGRGSVHARGAAEQRDERKGRQASSCVIHRGGRPQAR